MPSARLQCTSMHFISTSICFIRASMVCSSEYRAELLLAAEVACAQPTCFSRFLCPNEFRLCSPWSAPPRKEEGGGGLASVHGRSFPVGKY